MLRTAHQHNCDEYNNRTHKVSNKHCLVLGIITASHLSTVERTQSTRMAAVEIMLPCEVHTSRTSHEVGSKFARSWLKVHLKLDRSSFEVGPHFIQSWLTRTYAFRTKWP